MSDVVPSVRKSTLLAEAALVLVTLLWGMSFPWMKNWQDTATDCPGGPLLSGVTLTSPILRTVTRTPSTSSGRLLNDFAVPFAA